jgi:hypothetical protein
MKHPLTYVVFWIIGFVVVGTLVVAHVEIIHAVEPVFNLVGPFVGVFVALVFVGANVAFAIIRVLALWRWIKCRYSELVGQGAEEVRQ